MPITEAAVARFVRAYRTLIAVTREAIQHASVIHADAHAWENTALPNFEKEMARIDHAQALFLIGAPNELAELADGASHLSKNLDWCCSLSFAGPEFEKKLDQAVTEVVVSAYQVYSGKV